MSDDTTQDRKNAPVDQPEGELSEDELSAVAGGIATAVGVPPDPCAPPDPCLPPDPCSPAASKAIHFNALNVTKKLDKSSP